MDRITDINGNVSSAPPALPAFGPAAQQGYFQERDPNSPAGATLLRAYWFNAVTEEMRNAIVASGQTPNVAIWTQLLTSMNRMGAINRTLANASSVLTLDQTGIVLVDASGGPLTLTLPDAGAVPWAMRYVFRRIDSSANLVTIASTAAQNLGAVASGLQSFALPAGLVVEVVSQAAPWWACINVSGYRDLHTMTSGSGSVTVPAWGSVADLFAVGGGGGGGAALPTGANQVSVGPGGNGGTWCRAMMAVTPGQAIAYSVGAGGAGGYRSAGANGQSGGTTTIGGVLSAPGGNAAPNSGVNSAPLVQAPSRASRHATGGYAQSGEVQGSPGICGSNASNGFSGAGGDGPYGGGGSGVINGLGEDGDAYGAGGGGGQCDQNQPGYGGGNGFTGVVIMAFG